MAQFVVKQAAVFEMTGGKGGRPDNGHYAQDVEHPFSKTNVYDDDRWCGDCIRTLLAMPCHDDEDEWDKFTCIPCLELAQACWEHAYEKLMKYDYDEDDDNFYAAKLASINKARISALTQLLVKNNIEIGAESKSQFQMQPAVQAQPEPEAQPEAEAAEAAAEAQAQHQPEPEAAEAGAAAQPEPEAAEAGAAAQPADAAQQMEEAVKAAYKAAESLAKSVSEADDEYMTAYHALFQADLETADARSEYESVIRDLEKYREDAIKTYKVVLRKKDAAEATFLAALGHKRSLMEEMQRARKKSRIEE